MVAAVFHSQHAVVHVCCRA